MNFEIQTPNKAMYKFNEVTSVTGVKPYVLRFWESEFAQIQPELNESGQKRYRADDVELIQKIKRLLFEDKLSIPEVKSMLENPSAELAVFENISKETSEAAAAPEISIQSRSEDLKLALEKIIEKNSRPLTDEEKLLDQKAKEENRIAFELKAKSIADKVKADVKEQTHLLDKDIVNLVSAKKKLTVLLGKIDNICEHHHW